MERSGGRGNQPNLNYQWIHAASRSADRHVFQRLECGGDLLPIASTEQQWSGRNLTAVSAAAKLRWRQRPSTWLGGAARFAITGLWARPVRPAGLPRKQPSERT